MAVIVQKFGGTSLASVRRVQAAADRVAAARAEGHDVVVVCSAMGNETDRLLGLAEAMADQPDPRELDVLLAAGEQVAVSLLAIALRAQGCPAQSYLGDQVPIVTEPVPNKARIVHIETERLRATLEAGIVPVVAGYQGVDDAGNVTTIGRGGSDTTAVALAVALDADECQILSDVDGVYTTDPHMVGDARRLERLTFEEMMEMAGQGSRVLQTRAVEFAGKHNVRLRVMPSAHPGAGTLICSEEPGMEAPLVAGIAFNGDEAAVTVTQVPHEPGIAFRILEPVSNARIDVDMIVLNAGAGTGLVDFSFTVHRKSFNRTLELVEHAIASLPHGRVLGDSRVVKISLVGVGMRSHAGIATRMLKALAQEQINVRMISTSEIKVSVVVDERCLDRGVRALHAAFGLAHPQHPAASRAAT